MMIHPDHAFQISTTRHRELVVAAQQFRRARRAVRARSRAPDPAACHQDWTRALLQPVGS